MLAARGPAVSLRYATSADAGALFELGRDPEVTRWFSWGPYEDVAEAQSYIETLGRRRRRGERLEFVIVDGDDRPIGVTGLSDFSQRDAHATIGTWLGRAHWGTGVNRAAKVLLLRVAFEELGLARVNALAHPENGRSLAALERLGFVREGLLRGWHRHRGVLRDCVILGLLREEWVRSPLAEEPATVAGRAPEVFYSQRK